MVYKGFETMYHLAWAHHIEELLNKMLIASTHKLICSLTLKYMCYPELHPWPVAYFICFSRQPHPISSF